MLKKLLKPISWALIFSFTLSSLQYGPRAVYAQAGPADAQFTIPQETGSIDRTFRGKTPEPQVYYIQDAHNSLEAQENIAKLIRHLAQEKNVGQVLVEGYEGEGPLDPLFSTISDSKKKERISYFFMDHLRLNGARYAFINRDRSRDFKLIGIESTQDYLDNLKAYEEGAKDREAIAQDLAKISKELNALGSKLYPREIKEWQKLKGRFESKQLSLADYVFRLFKLGAPGEYPHLSLVANYLGKDQLTKEEQEELNRKLRAVDSKIFFSELDQCEADLIGKALKDPIARKTLSYQRQIDLLGKLNDFSLTPEEYQKLNFSHITSEIAHFLAQNLHKSLVLSSRWEELIQSQIRFYELAKKRDENFQGSLGTVLDQKRTVPAIVVAGGFHQSGITGFLEKEKISHAVISPKITKDDPIHEKRYDFLMTGQRYLFEKPFLTAPLATLQPQLEMLGGDVKSLVSAAISALGPDGRIDQRKLQAVGAVDRVNRIVEAARGSSLGKPMETWKRNPWLDSERFLKWLVEQDEINLDYVQNLISGQLKLISTENQSSREKAVFQEFCELVGIEANPEWDQDSETISDATRKRFLQEIRLWEEQAGAVSRQVRKGVLGTRYTDFESFFAHKRSLSIAEKIELSDIQIRFIEKYAERLLQGKGVLKLMTQLANATVYGQVNYASLGSDIELFVFEKLKALDPNREKMLTAFRKSLGASSIDMSEVEKLPRLAAESEKVRAAFVFTVGSMRNRILDGLLENVQKQYAEIISRSAKGEPLTAEDAKKLSAASHDVKQAIERAIQLAKQDQYRLALENEKPLVDKVLSLWQNDFPLFPYQVWIIDNSKQILAAQATAQDDASLKKKITSFLPRKIMTSLGLGTRKTSIYIPVDRLHQATQAYLEARDKKYEVTTTLARILERGDRALFDGIFKQVEARWKAGQGPVLGIPEVKGSSLGQVELVLTRLPADKIVWTDLLDYLGLQDEMLKSLMSKDAGAFAIQRAIDGLPDRPKDLRLFLARLEKAFLKKRLNYYKEHEKAKRGHWNVIENMLQAAFLKGPDNFISPKVLHDVILNYKNIVKDKEDALWTDPESLLKDLDFKPMREMDEMIGAAVPAEDGKPVWKSRLAAAELLDDAFRRLIYGEDYGISTGRSLGGAIEEMPGLLRAEEAIRDSAESEAPFDIELLRPGLEEAIRRSFSITQVYFRLKLKTAKDLSADDILRYLKYLGNGDPDRTRDEARREIKRSVDLVLNKIERDTKKLVRQAKQSERDYWVTSILEDLESDLEVLVSLPGLNSNAIDPKQVERFLNYCESAVVGLVGQGAPVGKVMPIAEEVDRVQGVMKNRLPVSEADLRKIYHLIADLGGESPASGASLGSVDRVLDKLPIGEMTYFDLLDYWVVRVVREEDEFTSGSKAYLIQKAIDELPVPPDNLRAFIPQLERIFIAKKLPLLKKDLKEPFPKETQAALRLLDWLIFEELKDHPEEMIDPDRITDRLEHYRQLIVLYGNRLWNGGAASILNHSENTRVKQVADHLSLYEDKPGLRADAHLAVVVTAETYLKALIMGASLGSDREDLTDKPYRDEITPTELRAREFSLALHYLVFGGRTKDVFEHEGLVIARLKLAKAIADGIEEEKKKQAGVLAYILERVRAHDADIKIGVRIQDRLTLFLEKLKTEDPPQYTQYQKYLDGGALWNLENNSYDDLKTKARFLKSEINKFENKFSKAVEADVETRLHELNSEIRALLTLYNKVQLKRTLHFMSGKPPESWNTTAIANLLLSVRNHTKRHELEVLRENIRNKKSQIVRQFSAETAAYKDIDLDLLGAAKIADILTHLSEAGWDIRKGPVKGYVVPQRRWVKQEGKTHDFYVPQVTDIPYDDLSSAIRSQVHTIESQLLDIGAIQERVGDLEDALHQIRGYGYRPVTQKEMKRALRISREIEEWLEKGLVDPKTLSLPHIKTVLIALEEASKIPSTDIEARKANFAVVESSLRAVIDRLESDRLQDIDRIKRKVGNRLLALARATQTAENRIIFRTSEILYRVSKLERELGAKRPLDLNQEKDKTLLGRYKEIVRDTYRLKNGYFSSTAGGPGYRRSHPLIVGVAGALYRLEKVLEGGGTIEKSGVGLGLVKQNLIMIQANMIYLSENDADFEKKRGAIEKRIAPRVQEIITRIAKLEKLREDASGKSLGLTPDQTAQLHDTATRFLSGNLGYLDRIIRELEVMDRAAGGDSDVPTGNIREAFQQFHKNLDGLHASRAASPKIDPRTDPVTLYANTLAYLLNRGSILSLRKAVAFIEGGTIVEQPTQFYANRQYIKGVERLKRVMQSIPDVFDLTVVEAERFTRLDTDKILGQSLGTAAPRSSPLGVPAGGKSYLDSIEDEARKAAGVIGLPKEVIEKIIEAEHIFRVEYDVVLKDGTKIHVLAFRVQHNSARGPYKGGTRYLPIFITEEAAEKEDKALAFGMTLKTAVVNIPLGGGKGIVNFVVDKKDLLNKETGERDLAKEEEFQAKLMRGYVRAVMEKAAQDPSVGRDAFGAFIDSPAPDMGTGGKQMAWGEDEYLRILLERMRDKKGAGIYEPRLGARLLAFFTDPANSALLEDVAQNVILKKYLELIKEPDMIDRVGATPELATFTGKPAGTPPGQPEDPKDPYLGGSQGRAKATGQGGLFVLETVLRKLTGREDIRGLEAAVQGYGNVGGEFSKIVYERGVKIIAISTAYKKADGKYSPYSFYHKEGIDIPALEKWIQDEMTARKVDRPDLFSYEPFAVKQGYQVIPNDNFWSLPVDVFVPAAGPEVITKDAAEKIVATSRSRGRKPLILELANGPTKPEADEVLKKEGIIAVPDILANTGGVSVSFSEMHQNIANERWDVSVVDRILKEKMVDATNRVIDMQDLYRQQGINLSFREATYLIGVMKVAFAEIARNSVFRKKYGALDFIKNSRGLILPDTQETLRLAIKQGLAPQMIEKTYTELEQQVEKTIDEISVRFSVNPNRHHAILVTGATASGKSVIIDLLTRKFDAKGKKVRVLDVNRTKITPDDMTKLLSGRTVEVESWDYYIRRPILEKVEPIAADEIVVLEGIKSYGFENNFGTPNVYRIFVHANPDFSFIIDKKSKYPLTSYHLRRLRDLIMIKRDLGPKLDGQLLIQNLRSWTKHRNYENTILFPNLERADQIFSLFDPFELAVMREEILQILRDANEELTRLEKTGQKEVNVEFWRMQIDFMKGLMVRTPSLNLAQVPTKNTFNFLISASSLGRLELDRAAQPYIDLISKGDALFPQVPDVFLVLGNPDIGVYLRFAEEWKRIMLERQKDIPIVLAGGRGRGTPPMIDKIMSYYGQRAELNADEILWLGRARNDESVTEAQLMRFILIKEGVADGVITAEKEPSGNTAANFTNTLPSIELAVRDVVKPTVAIVTDPQLLLRIGATVRKLWKGKIGAGWSVKTLKLYDVSVKDLSDDQLIERLGYVVGYPEKYRERYKVGGKPVLNSGREFRGSQSKNNPNVETPPMTEDEIKAGDKLEEDTHAAFEKFLDTREVVYDEKWNRLTIKGASLGQVSADLASLSEKPAVVAVSFAEWNRFGAEVQEEIVKHLLEERIKIVLTDVPAGEALPTVFQQKSKLIHVLSGGLTDEAIGKIQGFLGDRKIVHLSESLVSPKSISDQLSESQKDRFVFVQPKNERGVMSAALLFATGIPRYQEAFKKDPSGFWIPTELGRLLASLAQDFLATQVLAQAA